MTNEINKEKGVKSQVQNVIPFPLVKKYIGVQIIPDDVNRNEIEDITKHYVDQLKMHISNLGFPTDRIFDNDMQCVSKFLNASLCRTVGKHHKLHDAIDKMIEEN